MVQATDHFMEEVATDVPVILMGHSSGAQKAALLALDHSLLSSSERVRAMIVCGLIELFFHQVQSHH